MRKCRACLALAAALAACGAAAAPAAAIRCEVETMRDYVGSLQGLPGIRPLPGGSLPFAPRGVGLSDIHRGELAVGPTEVGFRLAYDRGNDGIAVTRRLNWKVEVEVSRIDRRGVVRETEASLARRVDQLVSMPSRSGVPADLEIATKVSTPGIYRVEILFSGPSGRRLARYGRYLQLLAHPRLGAEVSLNADAFRAGDRLEATVENRGTESLLHGLAYRVEQFDGAAWVQSPMTPTGPIPAIAFNTLPGQSSSCWGFAIPADAAPGLYRFTWSGQALRTYPEPMRIELTRHAEFTILPPG